MGVGRRREQIQKTEFFKIYGAKLASRVFVQWGFTVWSWWLLWAKHIANEVQVFVKSDQFLESSIGRLTEQGLPVVTPEDVEYGRKGLPAEQRWLVSTEELDRVREKLEGWDPFRWWLKAQWTQSVGEVLVDAFKKTKKWKEHKLLEKEVAEQVWAAVRAAPELRVFNRSTEVVQGALLGAVTRRKKTKMFQDEYEECKQAMQQMMEAVARKCTNSGSTLSRAGGWGETPGSAYGRSH